MAIRPTLCPSFIAQIDPRPHPRPRPRPSFTKQASDSSQDAVLLGVVRVVFAGYLENGWEGSCVGIDPVAYPLRDLRDFSTACSQEARETRKRLSAHVD
jgi:hypothetical protein